MEIEQPVACRDGASFDFHPTLAGVLGATLIRHKVIQMCSLETRLYPGQVSFVFLIGS